MRGAAGPGDDDLQPARFGAGRVLEQQVRGAVGRHHPDFVGYPQRIQRVRRVFQSAPVGSGAHDQANQWIHKYRIQSRLGTISLSRRVYYAPVAARRHLFS